MEKKEKMNNYLLYRGLVSRMLTDATFEEAIEAAKKEYKEHGKINDIELYRRTDIGTEPVLKWPAGNRPQL